jgi:hypothetical protein
MVTYTQSTASALMARGVVTTRTLIDLDYKLEMQCRGCARNIVAEPYELRRMFPVATPLHEAGQKLRCERCGAKNPQMWVWVMGWTREKRRRR